jgi:hypothetical protein
MFFGFFEVENADWMLTAKGDSRSYKPNLSHIIYCIILGY